MLKKLVSIQALAVSYSMYLWAITIGFLTEQSHISGWHDWLIAIGVILFVVHNFVRWVTWLVGTGYTV